MFKNALYEIIMGFIFIMLTTDFMSLVSIYGAVPNLLLIFVVFIGQKKGIMRAQIIGFIIGMIMDFFSLYTGILALTYLILGHVAGRIHYRFFVVGLTIQTMILMFVFSMFYTILMTLGTMHFVHVNFGGYLLDGLGDSVYTALVAPFIFAMLNYFNYKINES